MKKFKRECEEEITRKKDTVEYFDILPDEILTSILVWLPAELLRYKFKYVCRRWFNIITHQILFDETSIIIQKPAARGHVYRTRLVDFNEGISNLRLKEQYLNIPCKGRVRSWCNELLLITEPHKNGSLFIFNLITMVGSALPRGSKDCGGHAECKCGLGIAFDKFNGVYKVVHVFAGAQTFQCEMFMLKNESLFLNSSKWKTIDGPSYMGNRKYFWDDPVSVDGRYFHWHVHSAEFVVSMDIVEEMFHKIRLPQPITKYSLLEMGGYLCLLSNFCDKHAIIWILKHFQKQEWHKRQTIRNLGYIPMTGCQIRNYPSFPVPIGSLKNGSYIICRNYRDQLGLFCYKLENGRMAKLDIPIDVDERCLAQSTTIDF